MAGSDSNILELRTRYKISLDWFIAFCMIPHWEYGKLCISEPDTEKNWVVTFGFLLLYRFNLESGLATGKNGPQSLSIRMIGHLGHSLLSFSL